MNSFMASVCERINSVHSVQYHNHIWKEKNLICLNTLHKNDTCIYSRRTEQTSSSTVLFLISRNDWVMLISLLPLNDYIYTFYEQQINKV